MTHVLQFNSEPRKTTLRVTFDIGYETAASAVLYRIFGGDYCATEWNTNFTVWEGITRLPLKTIKRLLWECAPIRLVVIDEVVYTRPNAELNQREIDNKRITDSLRRGKRR